MGRQEVKFGVKFMDWKKGEKATLGKKFADRYIRLGVCAKVKPPARKKATGAPSNKRAAAPVNK